MLFILSLEIKSQWRRQVGACVEPMVDLKANMLIALRQPYRKYYVHRICIDTIAVAQHNQDEESKNMIFNRSLVMTWQIFRHDRATSTGFYCLPLSFCCLLPGSSWHLF